MTVKITTANGGSDSLDFGCAQTAIVATVTGTEVSSGEGKLELKTTTGGTSAAKLTIAANGTVTLASPALSNVVIQLQTAVASTSGTSIDFTGIPANVKRVSVLYSGVSVSGTSNLQIQLGTSGGIVTSGYASGIGYRTGEAASTAGFMVAGPSGAASLWSGVVTINSFGSDIWTSGGTMSRDDGWASLSGGYKDLGGTLTQIRITTINGSDTFDAGSVNISWEF
jgi:hypothetical protein